ncbi:two-component system sensor histidine kinase AgrC [Metabacillus crassostreae]|uniref:sensor histidine kinase n=1 Tax=Metabacillus crassostreae TaxID=929098 RepID=UPI00195EEEE2|nr:GHKL domain-containing protein [Metabacillus crassostreae]MBM7606621.1 two-component system sensor histidine kinase AgrC [Metabacillus crassostreae]
MDLLTIHSLLTVIIQMPLLLYFYTYVLDLKWSKKELLTIIFVIFLPICILFQFIGSTSVFYLVIILAIMIYLKTKIIGFFFHMLMSLILLVISDNLSYIIAFRLLHDIGNQEIVFIGYLLLLIVFAITFAFCYKQIMKYLISHWVFNNYVSYIFLLLGIATVVFIYINIMAIDYDNFYESVQNNLALFLVYFVLLAISIVVLSYLAFKQFKMKQREQEMRNFESYVASLEQINQDMRKFKHDYVNILSSLRTFIDDKDFDGLHTYFYDHILEANHQEQLNQQAMMKLKNMKINSLKGLLTTKILQAQSHRVPFYLEIVEEITDISVDPIILNRMIGILLDNAIEAAREIENGEVRIAFIKMNEEVLFVVTNTFDEKTNIKVHEIYQEGFSTKGENRGLGLANLLQMKNELKNVRLNTKISSPQFIQEIAFERCR